MTLTLREFEIEDYARAYELWGAAEGVVLRDADSRESVARYLVRNPGLSFVALRGGVLVGTALSGHDGRRGYLQHVAVSPSERRSGVGRLLVERCLGALRAEGIAKCHLMVLPGNEAARAFWKRLGWVERGDVLLVSRALTEAVNP
jgi:ribosomal protein S18 acetylase RimI-like enzyme